jgi:hypothetical protein
MELTGLLSVRGILLGLAIMIRPSGLPGAFRLAIALLTALLLTGLSPSLAQQAELEVTSKGKLVRTQGWLWGFLGGEERSGPFERERPLPRERPAIPTGGAVCVRLCDGFFWPVSQSIANVSRAAKQCELACPGRSRLFIRNLGTEPSDMVDLEGKPYSKLENAFRHQREYVSDCTCRGHPWEEQSLARHRAYAEAAAGKPGSQHVMTKQQIGARSREAKGN